MVPLELDQLKCEAKDLAVCSFTLLVNGGFNVCHFCSCMFVVTNWNSLILNGSWRGSTAGGCRNFPTFTDNPQFVIDLTEDADGDGKCSVLIALMQKNRRQQKKLGVRDLCIGYAVYKVKLLFWTCTKQCMHV